MSTYKREDKAFKTSVAKKADEVEYKPFRKTEPKTITVTIDEEGDVLFLASTQNDVFLELGNVVTRRASHVEPVGFAARRLFHFLRLFGDKNAIAEWTRNWKVQWRVNTKPVGGPILRWVDCYTPEQIASIVRIGDSPASRGLALTATFSDRQEAIDAEIKFLNRFFLTR